MEVVNALGRRKSAIARIFVSEGTGKITINKRDLAEYFPSSILQYVVKQPLNKLGVAEKYDIKVNLCGGGFTGQSQALRLAIARALVKINAEDKAALRAEGFMTRDPRSVRIWFRRGVFWYFAALSQFPVRHPKRMAKKPGKW